MFYKLLPYLCLALAATGIYFAFDNLQQSNSELTKANSDLTSQKERLTTELSSAQSEALKQLEAVNSLKADFERDQRTAKELAEEATKQSLELQQRLDTLMENARNDPQDACSFTDMPDHIVRLLFNTGDTTSTDSHNQDRDSQGLPAKEPNSPKPDPDTKR